MEHCMELKVLCLTAQGPLVEAQGSMQQAKKQVLETEALALKEPERLIVPKAKAKTVAPPKSTTALLEEYEDRA